MALAAAALWLLAAASPVFAHKLKVFAYAAGDRIEGTAYFAGGGAASGASILIQDATGRTLAELAPSKDGSFSYAAKAPTDHVVIAESGDGHRAEWQVTADELAPAFETGPTAGPSGQTAASRPAPIANESERDADQGTGTSGTPAAQAHLQSAVDRETLAAIELAVARQVRPLREQLERSEDKAQLRDILGGIGYIIGLTGFALWLRCRKSGTTG